MISIGIISLFALLGGLVLLFMGLWIGSFGNSISNPISNIVEYGIQPNMDGVLLNVCGPTGDQPCLFNTPTVAQAIDQCNVLGTLCGQFAYVENTGQMRVISDSGQFSSVGTDTYLRLDHLQ
jgi:hypothetical protein